MLLLENMRPVGPAVLLLVDHPGAFDERKVANEEQEPFSAQPPYTLGSVLAGSKKLGLNHHVQATIARIRNSLLPAHSLVGYSASCRVLQSENP